MMKRIVFFVVCFALLLAFSACGLNGSDVSLTSGIYYMDGDYEDPKIPYLQLDLEENSFALGRESMMSYAEHGSFKITNGKLKAKSQNTTFVFEIKDATTLILIDAGNDEYFQLLENSEFVCIADLCYNFI